LFSDFKRNPAPDFSQPLDLLGACHNKIRFHCELLVKLCEYLESNAVDSDAIKSAKQVHRYFSTSATLHHLDEEEDLFPALNNKKELSSSVRELIIKLQQEHVSLDNQWQIFENLLKNQALVELPDMKEQALAMKASYDQHIDTENRFILPEAEKLLSREEIVLLGEAMQKRRQQFNDAFNQ
jgi:hemerythrin-like domain-containing protein